MTNIEETAFRLADGGGRPNLKVMQAELALACERAVDRMDAMAQDENVRYCRWPHQRPDGRLPELVGGRPAEPWPRASDTRVHLADSLIVDQVRALKTAARRARLIVRGTESGDMAAAGKVQLYIDHLRNTRIKARVEHEIELAANWRQTHGRAVMAVVWQQEWARDFEEVSLAQLQQLAAAQPAGPVAALLAVLHDPDKDVRRQLVSTLAQMYPDLDRGEAWRQLQALRDTGAMSLPVRYQRANEPRWKALKPWRDVFYPLNTEEAQDAPWIAWRVTLNAAQLEEKRIGEDWPEAFVEAVRGTAGQTLLDTYASRPATTAGRREIFRDTEEEMAGLHEVFYVYYTHSDESGVPCKWCTVMSPHVKVSGDDAPFGLDEPLGYDHGQLPFVFLRRERIDRMVEESRGVPEIAGTSQGEVKSLRDARIDQTELYLQPPTIRPEREIGLPLKIRPRGEIGERRVSATRQWEVRNTAPAAEPLEVVVQRDMDRYFARNRAEDPARCALHDQDLADDFCGELEQCWMMTLQLCQQFEDSVTFARIVGGKPVPFRVSRDEIQGRYNLQLFFNTDQLDPEKMKAKAELLRTMLVPLDRYGIYNLAPVLGGLGAYYFPEFADEMIQGVQQAGQKEVQEEQNNWAQMMAGVEPAMVEDGQNFQLRLQWLQNQLSQPGSQQRMQQLPDTRALVERRFKHLQFMVQQQQNAQTGRVGVAPAQPGQPQS